MSSQDEYYDSEYESESEYEQTSVNEEQEEDVSSSNASFTPVTVAVAAPKPKSPVALSEDEQIHQEALTIGLSKRGVEWAKDYIDGLYEKEITFTIIDNIYALSRIPDCEKELIELLQFHLESGVDVTPVMKNRLNAVLHYLQSTMDCD